MSYAEITFKDRNPVKRWLQLRRLASAIELTAKMEIPSVICDFGAGNGELCKRLAKQYPDATIICYEPTPGLLGEARSNLASLPHVQFCSDIESVTKGAVDMVFCLEVFEHLPTEETIEAFQRIRGLLRTHGIAVIGVPVEIGLPALYKGCFRMARRFGEFDATPRNILLSFLGLPPKDRPTEEISPGFRFHYYHIGFDYRRLREVLCSHLKLLRVYASPFAMLGSWLNPEVYFIAQKTS